MDNSMASHCRILQSSVLGKYVHIFIQAYMCLFISHSMAPHCRILKSSVMGMYT